MCGGILQGQGSTRALLAVIASYNIGAVQRAVDHIEGRDVLVPEREPI